MSISTAQAAWETLRFVVGAVDGLRSYLVGEPVERLGVLVSPPALTWEHYPAIGQPTNAEFSVFVVGPNDQVGTVITKLLSFVDPVVSAIEQNYEDAVVTQAFPGIYSQFSATESPCYTITVEVSL